jgi:hypothetical protein
MVEKKKRETYGRNEGTRKKMLPPIYDMTQSRDRRKQIVLLLLL